MACEFTCDGCGKEEPANEVRGAFLKPFGWFMRSDDDGAQVACSRKCIDEIAQKSGKTSVVLPF